MRMKLNWKSKRFLSARVWVRVPSSVPRESSPTAEAHASEACQCRFESYLSYHVTTGRTGRDSNCPKLPDGADSELRADQVVAPHTGVAQRKSTWFLPSTLEVRLLSPVPFRGRLMVGHLALNQATVVRPHPPEPFGSGLTVGHRVLAPVVLVRVQPPNPSESSVNG